MRSWKHPVSLLENETSVEIICTCYFWIVLLLRKETKEDLILLHLFQHDAQMDYYGTRLATCSSDRTVKIFDVRNGGQILVADLRG